MQFCSNMHNRVSQLTLHHLSFTGYNMQQHLLRSGPSTCQYGGLFIVRIKQHFTFTLIDMKHYLTLCDSINQQNLELPYVMDSQDILTYFFIFITFPGYSTGSVELSTGQGHCIGDHWHFDMKDLCRGDNKLTYTNWPVFLDNNLDEKSLEECHTSWLTYNMNIDFQTVSKPIFEKCEPLSLPLSVARFLLAKTLVANRTDQEFLNVSVTNTTDNMHYPSRVDLSFTGNDMFPIFAVRLITLERKICSLRAGSPFDLGKVYDVGKVYVQMMSAIQSNVPDVWTDVDRFVTGGALNEYYHNFGYNHGTCHSLLHGSVCSPSSSYITTTVHLQPSHFIDYASMPWKIDVALKKSTGCYYHCSLNVVVEEYRVNTNLQEETTTRRRHEWLKVYHVTWQVITSVQGGFRLMITPTCPINTPCTNRLCDVSIAIGPPLTSNALGMFPKENITKYLKHVDRIFIGFLKTYATNLSEQQLRSFFKSPIPKGGVSSEFIFGNWYDARDHCISRNSSLFKVTRSFSKQLQDVINSEELKHDWHNIHENFYAGLHREDEVG